MLDCSKADKSEMAKLERLINDQLKIEEKYVSTEKPNVFNSLTEAMSKVGASRSLILPQSTPGASRRTIGFKL